MPYQVIKSDSQDPILEQPAFNPSASAPSTPVVLVQMGNDTDSLPLYPAMRPNAPMVQVLPSGMPMDHQPHPMPHTSQMMLLGPENTVTTCMFCKASIKTAVKYTSNTKTHIAAALWCTACCLCCVPYSSDTAKNADHYCPNCQRYLGTYHR